MQSLIEDKRVVWEAYLDFLATMKKENHLENLDIGNWYLSIYWKLDIQISRLGIIGL